MSACDTWRWLRGCVDDTQACLNDTIRSSSAYSTCARQGMNSLSQLVSSRAATIRAEDKHESGGIVTEFSSSYLLAGHLGKQATRVQLVGR